MPNSTPNPVAWLADYQRYLSMVEDGLIDDAASLKLEIQEGLSWVGLEWDDLEFAHKQKR